MGIKRIFLKKNRRLYNGLLLVIFTAILFFIGIYKMETNKLDLKIGDIAPTDIRATKEILDEFTSEKLRKEAMNRVEPRYRISPSVQMIMKDQIKDFLDTARDIKGMEASVSKKTEAFLEGQELDLTTKEIQIALGMNYKALNDFENNLMDLINQVMGGGISESELEYEKENLSMVFESLNMTENEKHLGLALMSSTIKDNKFLDSIETERKKEEAANKVQDVLLRENEIIVYKGNFIGERELSLIRESGLLKEDKKLPLGTMTGMGILILISMVVIVGYVYYFNNEILYNNHLLIILIVLLITIIISKELYFISPYIMPLTTAALLISILIEPKLALIINIFLSLYMGFILKLDGSLTAMYILSGSISALLAMQQGQRYNILINGLIVGVTNVLTLTAFGLVKGIGGLNSLADGGYSFLNGIIAAILTLGSLPLWENVFSILTNLKLLELSNPNQPLLKKLLLETPGTYHHSILVGNLAEAAAEAISANPLIARVGSYYHDIGKTVRPYYFAENQFGIENPHNKLQPMQSTNIITSHTTDGIKLAKEDKLPREIIDIIEQHHGDTAVAYFYYRAKEENKDIDISIDDFRYKGKKPQSKEAAIVMLADSSEAAVRSIKDLTKDSIEDMVRKIVQGKLKDGQLDQCDITLKEIEIIIQTFIRVLAGIYHDRIEYPEVEKEGAESE